MSTGDLFIDVYGALELVGTLPEGTVQRLVESHREAELCRSSSASAQEAVGAPPASAASPAQCPPHEVDVSVELGELFCVRCGCSFKMVDEPRLTARAVMA